MLYAQVDAQDRQRLLSEMQLVQDAKMYRRLKLIDLSGQGLPVSELARLFDLSPATVRTYIHAFNTGGLTGLRPGYGRGRPPAVDWTADQWLDVLSQAPCHLALLGTAAQNWTQRLLRDYLALYHHVHLSQSALSKSLHRAGLRWRRAKLRVHSPDPLYTVKRQRVADLQQLALAGTLTSEAAAHPRSDEPPRAARLAFLDSTDLHWCPDLGSAYIRAGGQLKVDTPGLANPWYALFGSLVYPSGEGLYTIHARKRTVDLLEHLHLLIDQDPLVFWFVVLDNASAHTTAAVEAFALAYQERLELVYLPTYSPHLNLIERLWRFLRGQITRNRFYASLNELAEATVAWLEQVSWTQLCSLIGVDDSSLAFVQGPFE
jgi:transposase